MAKDHIILSRAESEAVSREIKENRGNVIDQFAGGGGWTIDTEAGKLKDGRRAISRELVEELQRRGGNNATVIAGVDLKNRPNHSIKDSDWVKGGL